MGWKNTHIEINFYTKQPSLLIITEMLSALSWRMHSFLFFFPNLQQGHFCKNKCSTSVCSLDAQENILLRAVT